MARVRLHPACLIGIAVFVAGGAVAAQRPIIRPAFPDPHPSKEAADFFEKKIRPIFVRRCYECHSGDPKKAKGHFVLDTRDGLRKGGESGPSIVPGHPDQSLLIEAIRYEGLEMPPNERLPDDEVAELVRWVTMGAPDPRIPKSNKHGRKIDLAEARKYWAFQRPKALAAPRPQDTHWPATDIDRFIRARQEQLRLQPVADADPVTLIRRVTFDLTGLPPTPEEVEAFLTDKSGNAWTTLVDRLLASPRFGERWARHWLDVVRFGESTGKERNLPYRYAWRYRNFVIDAFNADLPYDRFIVEQLAGDLLPVANPEEHNARLIATGFLAIGAKGVNAGKEQFRYEVIDDQIDVTSRAFLALTVACARCHDHKYDPIPTSDYYALAGIFHSTNTFDGAESGQKTATDADLLPLFDTRGDPAVFLAQFREQKIRDDERARITDQLEHIHKLQKQAAKAAAARKGKGRHPFPAGFRAFDEKRVKEEIRKLELRRDELDKTPTPEGDLAMGVREGSPGDSHLLNRGELKDKGPEVPRGVLTVLKNPQASVNPRHSGRLELAHWIASRDNPLTARVMVNRLWEHLFGQGLVESVDNFGSLGSEPTHPELLDALAVRFMDSKWSIKTLIRSMVLSRVYRLSSEHNAQDFAADPSNKFLWRMECRRLDAEEIRDALLAVGGNLDLSRPEGSPMTDLANGPIERGKALAELRKPAPVRSIYLPFPRGHVPEMLHIFDAADPNLIVGKRDVTTVPTQALYLMNNEFVMKQAEQLARRLLAHEGMQPAARIDLAYVLALGRMATDDERSAISRYLVDFRQSLEKARMKGNPNLAAWTSVCQTIFASGEFRYLY
jgi:hypothetical protein